MPTVDICSQSASSAMAASAPPSSIAAATASPSASTVTTTSAPATASSGEPATWTPSTASAFSRVRFHTRTSWPAAAVLRAIGAPMIPVPRKAIICPTLPAAAIHRPVSRTHATPSSTPWRAFAAYWRFS